LKELANLDTLDDVEPFDEIYRDNPEPMTAQPDTGYRIPDTVDSESTGIAIPIPRTGAKL